ncbi:hypothetical protein [Brevibacillus sp. SYSU BS000544]|uniref:hypothetical protein n=1 Tax=Brevibacillus sp. SYSU BS000544 TaxID=3416443 RepID=UPI003CE552FD
MSHPLFLSIILLLTAFISNKLIIPIFIILYLYYLLRTLRLISSLKAIFMKIKNLSFFYINSYEDDLKARIKLIKNLANFSLCCLFLTISTVYKYSEWVLNDLSTKSMDSRMLPIFTFFAAAFAFIGIAYLLHTRFGSSLVVIASTLFGFLSFFFLFLLGLMVLAGIMGAITNSNSTEFRVVFNDQINNFIDLGVVIIYTASDSIFFWISLFVSIIIQLITLKIIPIYNLKRSKFIFVSFNYLANVLILLLLYLSNDLSETVYNLFSHEQREVIIQALKVYGIEKFKDLFDKFINVTLFPYIFGSFIALVIIEYIENRNVETARKSYFSALNYHQIRDPENVVFSLKKAVLYGGTSYELLIWNQKDFESYLSYLTTVEVVEPNKIKKFVFSKMRQIRTTSKALFCATRILIKEAPLKFQQTSYDLYKNYPIARSRNILLIFWSSLVFILSFLLRKGLSLLESITIVKMIIDLVTILNMFANILLVMFSILSFWAFSSYFYYCKEKFLKTNLLKLFLGFVFVCILCYLLIPVWLSDFLNLPRMSFIRY